MNASSNITRKNILHEIAERTKHRIAEQKKIRPAEEVKRAASALPVGDFPFERALRSEGLSFICEVKKASPSKGIIAKDFRPLHIAREYEAAGAAAISVLTEPFWFAGDDKYLQEISREIKIPLLRKDFTVDDYMIYEAKLLGASAVLLICAMLNETTLAEYLATAHELGLCAIAEVHNEAETEAALKAGAKIIGVNNRCLKTFEVDITLSERLRKLVPPDVLFIAESGISTPADVARLREIGADAALIGESLMRSADKKAAIMNLRAMK
ncbi:MAG: indole-3-glycerol phosphate synthase TrpC [Defluviitaleaceae bacterium]|nr:indole-3-glycerol phosphate synthase TrpC [Defluviitaleaceae bacterium]